MTTSEQINEIAAASAKAQGELRPAIKDAMNPAFRSKYADLAAVIEAAHVYAKHGIAIFQDVTTGEAGVSVTTRLVHTSGQWMEFGPLTVPMAKRDAHGVGSAITYGKRYGLQAAALIPSEDDDANAASEPTKPQAEAKPPVVAPGYDDWLVKFSTAANTGTEPMRALFKEAQPAWRDYLTKHDTEKYDAIRKRGEDADRKKKREAA